MKSFLLAIIVFVGFAFTSAEITWLTDFDEAKEAAKTSEQYILLNFSGSDWCGNCIRLEKDFFSQPAFQSYAEENLVLLNADFPMKKANKLSAEQTKHNEALAELYNPNGVFPTTVIINSEGELISTLPQVCKDVDLYLADIKSAVSPK